MSKVYFICIERIDKTRLGGERAHRVRIVMKANDRWGGRHG